MLTHTLVLNKVYTCIESSYMHIIVNIYGAFTFNLHVIQESEMYIYATIYHFTTIKIEIYISTGRECAILHRRVKIMTSNYAYIVFCCN